MKRIIRTSPAGAVGRYAFPSSTEGRHPHRRLLTAATKWLRGFSPQERPDVKRWSTSPPDRHDRLSALLTYIQELAGHPLHHQDRKRQADRAEAGTTSENEEVDEDRINSGPALHSSG